MASPIKFVNSTGRVNNTPIFKCIYCLDKPANVGYPYCPDCFKMRSATERPCCSCNKIMIPCIPYTTMKRVFCVECTEKNKINKQKKQVKIAIPKSKFVEPVEPIEPDNSISAKQHLLQLFEGLSLEQIADIVCELLDKKEEIIQETLNENDMLKFQLDEMSK